MNYNNIVILENYQLLLEKALFSEYIKEANNSQTLKSKFSELDKKVPSGYKYLNNPSKEDEVEILKQISRSDMFKKAALGAGIGAATGLGSGLLLNKFKELKERSARQKDYERTRKDFVNNSITSNSINFLNNNKNPYDRSYENNRTSIYRSGNTGEYKRLVDAETQLIDNTSKLMNLKKELIKNGETEKVKKVEELIKIAKKANSDKGNLLDKRINELNIEKDKDLLNNLRKQSASHMKSLKDKVKSTSREYNTLGRLSTFGGAGAGLGLATGLASGIAMAKILAKNTKHVTIAGRKVYAVISKDEKTVYNLALPYGNGSKIIVKFIKASMNTI